MELSRSVPGENELDGGWRGGRRTSLRPDAGLRGKCHDSIIVSEPGVDS
jgi:hypothetical protein